MEAIVSLERLLINVAVGGVVVTALKSIYNFLCDIFDKYGSFILPLCGLTLAYWIFDKYPILAKLLTVGALLSIFFNLPKYLLTLSVKKFKNLVP